MVLEIKTLGDPVLRKPAADVEEFDEGLETLVENMFETMYASEGIGLAGPQVGVSRRVFVMDTREPGVEPRVVINPVIVESSDETEREEEGCLSVPGVTEVVERPARVVVEAQDAAGASVRIEASGLLARCIQHEIDHLDGILFLDRVSPIKRKTLLKKWQRLQEQAASS